MTLAPPESGSQTSLLSTVLTSLNPLGLLEKQKRDSELLQWGMESYNQAKSDRLQTESQWYVNLAFYYGKQNIAKMVSKATAAGYQYTVPKAPPWRVRMVINKIRTITRHEVARLTSQKPIFTVVPATTEDEDYQAARVGEAIFRAVYSDKKVARELRRAAWWSVITGTGYLKSYWDPNKVDTNSNQVGDFCIERVNPWYVFVPDLEAEDIEDQPWVCHASTKSPQYIKNTWGLDVQPEAKSVNLMEDAFLNLIGARNQKKDSVLCLEYWMKPGSHPRFPKGGMFVIIGSNIIVQSEEYPYKHGQFPFYKIDYVQSGKYYADSTITDLIPLQREYNRTHSQIIEAKNLMAKPRLVAPRGSINPRAITTEPGQVIMYTPGFDKPSELTMQSLPTHVFQELEYLRGDMDDISAQHEISRGGTPSQVTAATAISYLQEQDDSKLSATISSVEEAFQKLGVHILNLVVQFWNTERMVRVVGLDNAFEAEHWSANDLRGNTDLRVESGSALPQSKAAKQAFVMDLLKLGIIPPERALEMLDIGGIEKIYEEYLIDKRQVQRENLKLAALAKDQQALQQAMPRPVMDPATGQPQIDPATGQPVLEPPPLLLEPNSWDNHQVHIMLHNQYRKSQQFELLPPPIKAQFEQHVMIHEYMMMTGMRQPALGIPGQPVGDGAMVEEEQPEQGPPQGEQ
jgi:hypothetical protein